MIDKPTFDFDKIVARSRAAAKQLNGGVAYLLKKNKVEVIEGTARIFVPGSPVTIDDGQATAGAAGGAPAAPPK